MYYGDFAAVFKWNLFLRRCVTPVFRFVPAVAFAKTLIPPADIKADVKEAPHILNNFDVARGL